MGIMMRVTIILTIHSMAGSVRRLVVPIVCALDGWKLSVLVRESIQTLDIHHVPVCSVLAHDRLQLYSSFHAIGVPLWACLCALYVGESSQTASRLSASCAP